MNLRELMGKSRKERSGGHTNDGVSKEISRKLFSCILLGFLLVRNRDELLARSNCRKWSLHGEDTVLAQRRLDALWVGSFWQQELTVVLSVHRFALCLFLVFRVDQQFIVHGLDNNFLWGVLRDVESELQHFTVAFILDQRAVQTVQPGRVVLRAQRTVLSARGGAGCALKEVVAFATKMKNIWPGLLRGFFI